MSAVIGLVHEEKGNFGIFFPDFPGSTALGGSLDEVIERGREGLAGYVHVLSMLGKDPPKLRTAGELRADPSLSESLASAVLVAVEVELPTRAVRVNVTFDEGLLQRIDQAARRRGESRSRFLANAARAQLSGAA
jgi:predicted RNase H-like HicB family nuclease